MTRSVDAPIGSSPSKMTSRFFWKRFIFAIKLSKLTAFFLELEAASPAGIGPGLRSAHSD
jgi:hypothetical protein